MNGGGKKIQNMFPSVFNQHQSIFYEVSLYKCVSLHSDQYADPYYDYEMEALWRGGQYENFRVQYTEAPLPYHYTVSILHSLLRMLSLTSMFSNRKQLMNGTVDRQK